MRFKSSVLNTIKVRQYFNITHPKRFPKLRKQLATCIKQATPTQPCKRPPTTAASKYDGYKQNHRTNEIVNYVLHNELISLM